MSKGRRKHSPAFKVKVALEAVKGMVPLPLGSPRVSPSAPIWSRQYPLRQPACRLAQRLLWQPFLDTVGPGALAGTRPAGTDVESTFPARFLAPGNGRRLNAFLD